MSNNRITNMSNTRIIAYDGPYWRYNSRAKKVCNEIVSKRAQPDTYANTKWYLLYCMAGELEELSKLDACNQDYYSIRALYCACENDRLDVVEYLIETRKITREVLLADSSFISASWLFGRGSLMLLFTKYPNLLDGRTDAMTGYGPFRAACSKGWADVAQLLLTNYVIALETASINGPVDDSDNYKSYSEPFNKPFRSIKEPFKSMCQRGWVGTVKEVLTKIGWDLIYSFVKLALDAGNCDVGMMVISNFGDDILCAKALWLKCGYNCNDRRHELIGALVDRIGHLFTQDMLYNVLESVFYSGCPCMLKRLATDPKISIEPGAADRLLTSAAPRLISACSFRSPQDEAAMSFINTFNDQISPQSLNSLLSGICKEFWLLDNEAAIHLIASLLDRYESVLDLRVITKSQRKLMLKYGRGRDVRVVTRVLGSTIPWGTVISMMYRQKDWDGFVALSDYATKVARIPDIISTGLEYLGRGTGEDRQYIHKQISYVVNKHYDHINPKHMGMLFRWPDLFYEFLSVEQVKALVDTHSHEKGFDRTVWTIERNHKHMHHPV